VTRKFFVITPARILGDFSLVVPFPHRSVVTSLLAIARWCIWKHRCNCVFANGAVSNSLLWLFVSEVKMHCAVVSSAAFPTAKALPMRRFWSAVELALPVSHIS
jgi:hypothetical protein